MRADLEQYPTVKYVLNKCPECGIVDNFRVRYKYPDEGRMPCTPCKEKLRVEQQKSKWDNARAAIEDEGVFSPDQISLLHDMLSALEVG